MNKGMSLLEVTIGMSLFSILMVLVIETTLSIRDFSANYEESIELEEEGRRIIKQVTADFSNSAWYNGADFPKATPTISGYGNSVKFLRLRSNGSDTSQVGIAPFDFKTRTSRMSEWKTPSSTVPGLVVNGGVNGGMVLNSIPPRPLPLEISPTWEPILSKRGTPLDIDGNKLLSNLRQYQYVVESPANNSIGRGVLKRKYSDDVGVTWHDDTSIGDLGRHIHWFIIQPDPTTQRVRLFLELRGPEQQSGKAVSVRSFSTIIAMRSIK